jgi:mannonate dehydratase
MHRRALFGTLGAATVARSLRPARALPPLRLKLGCQESPTTDERLAFFARHGVRNICGSSANARPPGPYTVAELTELRARCEKQGISLDLPKHPDDPDQRQAFDFAYGYIRGLIQAASLRG